MGMKGYPPLLALTHHQHSKMASSPESHPRNLFLHHFHADQVFSFSEGCKGRSFRPKHGKLAFPDQVPTAQLSDGLHQLSDRTLLASAFQRSKLIRSLLGEEGQERYCRISKSISFHLYCTQPNLCIICYSYFRKQ